MAGAARHTAVDDVANDRRLQPLERLLVLQDREGVEQCLRGMFVHAVPGVNDGDVEMPRHQVRSARRRMPHDNAVRADRPQRVSGIEHRLAFFDARSGGLHERGHRAQRFCGELKRRAGPGRRFVKQQHDALAAQQRPRLLRIHAAGQLQQAQDVLRLEMFDPEQRTACGHIHRKKCKRCIIRGSRGHRKGGWTRISPDGNRKLNGAMP